MLDRAIATVVNVFVLCYLAWHAFDREPPVNHAKRQDLTHPAPRATVHRT